MAVTRGPVIVKMLLFPAPQKFNTFNTFNTFTIFTSAPISSAASPSGTTADPAPLRPPDSRPPSPCAQGRVPAGRAAEAVGVSEFAVTTSADLTHIETPATIA